MVVVVIMMNDYPVAVTLNGSEHAEKVLKKYKMDYFEKNKFNYADFDQYDHTVLWHTQTAVLEEQ